MAALPAAALLLSVLGLPQDPPRPDVDTGEVGKFRWPPQQGRTLQYRAVLTKLRKLPADVARAEKTARKAARMFTPSRPPKQEVAMTIDITLAVKEGTVDAIYQTALQKQSLRLDIEKPRKPARGGSATGDADAAAPRKEVPFLGNDKIPAVWGLPDAKADKNLAVPVEAIDRVFHHTFQKLDKKGTEPADLRIRYGDHLLPVIWTYPLPCWLGELVNTMDLDGEAVIGGKTLIRDGTRSLKLGYRSSRVSLKWTQAAVTNFTMTYTMQIEQLVSEHRDGKPIDQSWTWVFDIEGEARYSFREQAWDHVIERVKARPKEITSAQLRGLRDEVFEGTIRIMRQGTAGGSRKRGRGR